MGATVFLSLASTVCNGGFDRPQRIGCFSYGSGCCSEFYSGVVTPDGATRLKEMNIGVHLDARYRLTVEEYERLLSDKDFIRFGTRNASVNQGLVAATRPAHGVGPRLVLRSINAFHREYSWLD